MFSDWRSQNVNGSVYILLYGFPVESFVQSLQDRCSYVREMVFMALLMFFLCHIYILHFTVLAVTV